MAVLPKVATEAPAEGAGRPRKRFWETVTTTTPVALTLLGTVLAGLSSSEMTQAQYHRSLAAQHQSKAGDQWAFFQSKRIRHTVIEKALALRGDLPEGVTAAGVAAAGRRVAEACRREATAAGLLAAAVRQPGTELGPAGAALRQGAEELAAGTRRQAAETEKLATGLAGQLAGPEVAAVFAYVGTDKLPAVSETRVDDPRIEAALQAVSDRKTEDEIGPLIIPLDKDEVQQALAAAEANARAFEDAGKKVDQALREVDRLVARQAGLAQRVRRSADDAGAATADLPAGAKGVAAVQAAAVALAAAGRALQRAAEGLRDYQAARDDYTARRQEQEAKYNQRAAGLYEVEVRRDSLSSEWHRRRSKHFFYGMLCAQAGAAIGSMALAARQRSALWGMASVAGVIAVSFSIYVYLYV